MSRPLRIQAAGLTYHITARGVRRTSIYLDAVDRRRFLALLTDVVRRYALRCHAYCEMTNHYHLAVTTTDANLSRAVQQLNGDYAQWWNWRHQRAGHVFQSRFNAQIVQDDSYLANVCRYIGLNPVRSGMVCSPEQWPWSSYRAMAGLTKLPAFLDCGRVLEIVADGDRADAANLFGQYVLETDARALQLQRSAILGDDAFVARFEPYRQRASREIPRREGRRPLDAIFRGAITRAARNAAMVTAVDERYALAEIARYLEIHPSTVSKIVSEQGARAWKNHRFKT
ncbi:MAG TPA: transposase [Vicinamibacterales bacterium]|nr:transposase [Vicinamibacterales bacterium]